jgi:cobalamin-dependent methionine synthase I
MDQRHFVYFDSISVVPKKELILTRLGYKSNKTVLNDEQKDFLEESIKKGLSLCHARGIYGRYKIESNNGKIIILENKQFFESESLCKLLENSSEVALMAATVGSEVVDEAARQLKEGDSALGIIIDATASQTADAAVAWIMEFVSKAVRSEGKMVTKHRFSPGFKDLQMSSQKLIYDTLELSKLGLHLTDRFMLIPEKSVIAILGITDLDTK